MMMRLLLVRLVLCIGGIAYASTILARSDKLGPRQVQVNITTNELLDTAIQGLEADFEDGLLVASAFQDILNDIVPSTAPGSIPEALSRVSSAYAANPTNFLEEAAALVLNGLVPSDLESIVDGYTIESDQFNQNAENPKPPIYPQKSAEDAPYDIPEETLRSRIYIPPTFTYGEKVPVILVPPTAGEAGYSFSPNYGKLLAATSYADPVYLNVADAMLDDIQDNAEYVAYAINYISAISSRNVSIVGFSQASVAVRWAEKYWPSTRSVISSDVHVSPDYHGSEIAYLLCPSSVPCPPAILQQDYNSLFIATMRNNGGDSPYAPLTTLYSLFDEAVQPQEGTTASGYSTDAHDVGVTNVYMQQYCGTLLPGGAPYNTHEGLLYNALGWAVAQDAIKNGGPGEISNVDIAAECEKFAADGLSLDDILATEAIVPVVGFNFLAYPNKVVQEPPIKAYASKDIPAGYTNT